MHQKMADEFIGTQRHDLPATAVPVIAPFESDGAVFNLQDAVVGDDDAVGVTSEIFHDTGCILEGRLAVNYPFFSKTLAHQIGVDIRDLLLEKSLKFSPEFAGKYPYREKKFFREGCHLPRVVSPPEGTMQ